MEPPTVGGFTYGKCTAISSAFPLKMHCEILKRFDLVHVLIEVILSLIWAFWRTYRNLIEVDIAIF